MKHNFGDYYTMLENWEAHYLKRLTEEKSENAVYEITDYEENIKFGILIIKNNIAEVSFFKLGKEVENLYDKVKSCVRDFFGLKVILLD